MIETAIVVPAYMMVLFGLLFFGYATLGRQHQELAAAYTGWQAQPGRQDGEQLLERFLPWADARETELDLPVDRTYDSDIHYAEGTIETQLVAGAFSLTGGPDADYAFDLERVTVSLWNMALPEIERFAAWDPDDGMVVQERIHWDDASHYLNENRPETQTGFINAPISVTEIDPARPDPYDDEHYNINVARALTGASLGEPWIRRRRVALDHTYIPPYASIIHGGVSFQPGTPPEPVEPSTLSTYVALDYQPPLDPFTMRTQFEITNRTDSVRTAPSPESGPTAQQHLDQVADLFDWQALENPDDMDTEIEDHLRSLGIEDIWKGH